MWVCGLARCRGSPATCGTSSQHAGRRGLAPPRNTGPAPLASAAAGATRGRGVASVTIRHAEGSGRRHDGAVRSTAERTGGAPRHRPTMPTGLGRHSRPCLTAGLAAGWAITPTGACTREDRYRLAETTKARSGSGPSIAASPPETDRLAALSLPDGAEERKRFLPRAYSSSCPRPCGGPAPLRRAPAARRGDPRP
jgi:hypothetical protein